MSAPEKIWAGRTNGYGGWHEEKDFVNNTEYLRADIAEARIREAEAAAYRRAAAEIDDYPLIAPDADEARHYDEMIEYAQAIIISLIQEEPK